MIIKRGMVVLIGCWLAGQANSDHMSETLRHPTPRDGIPWGVLGYNVSSARRGNIAQSWPANKQGPSTCQRVLSTALFSTQDLINQGILSLKSAFPLVDSAVDSRSGYFLIPEYYQVLVRLETMDQMPRRVEQIMDQMFSPLWPWDCGSPSPTELFSLCDWRLTGPSCHCRCGVALDIWMLPLGNEVHQQNLDRPILFVNSEKFHRWRANMAPLKKLVEAKPGMRDTLLLVSF